MAKAARSQTGDAVVVAQGVTRVFKDFWMRDRVRAVDNLTFEIRPHEIFGLLGPNGSGKSTAIKMILGLLRPTRGRIAVFGKPPTDVPTKKRIGYLPEESYLYGYLNARETLQYYAKLFSIPPKTRTKRIDELLEMVGLTRAQHRPVHEYSKGMQRRIGLAQALINDPDFLILDEPTAGLDPIGTRQVKDLIVRLGERGKTVLLSSHLLADVEDVVDRMVILYGGKKREEGTCNDLLVSRTRSIVEIDALDENLVSDIDEVIRAKTRGERGVIRVSHPRQTLEEKFLDIVEQARAEKAETSGVDHGEVAAFLSGPAQGEHLIETLVEAGDEDALPPPEIESAQEDPVEVAAKDVLAELVASDPTDGQSDEPTGEPAGESPDQRAEPARSSDSTTEPHKERSPVESGDVDQDVIGSLLDDPERQT